MKRLIILALLAAILGGGYLYYRHLRTGPEYALVQAYQAVAAHDAAAFERYVDVSSVTGSLVDQVTARSEVLDGLVPGKLPMKGILGLLKPQLAQVARREVKQYVETGSVTAASGASLGMLNVSVIGLAGKLVGTDSQFKGIQYTREDGPQALVGLEFSQPRYDTTLVLEVKMRNQGDHWQATEITNAGQLLQHVARLEKRHLLRGL